MTNRFEGKARRAMQALIQSSLVKSENENVLRAVFNARYADDFDAQHTLWRAKWLNVWLVIGLIASLISLVSWAAAMMPRFGFFHMDAVFIGSLLVLTTCSTTVVFISAIGMTSIGKTPKLSKLL